MKEKTRSSIGFIGLLQLIFIVLKLCNVITWEWWIVLLPLIIQLGAFLVVTIGLIITAIVLVMGDD